MLLKHVRQDKGCHYPSPLEFNDRDEHEKASMSGSQLHVGVFCPKSKGLNFLFATHMLQILSWKLTYNSIVRSCTKTEPHHKISKVVLKSKCDNPDLNTVQVYSSANYSKSHMKIKLGSGS